MILAVLTLFGFVVAFLARNIAGDAHQIAMNNPTAVAARIAPMGDVRMGDPGEIVAAEPSAKMEPAAVAAAGAVDAEKIYNTVCMACHASGVAGAPKKGDDAAWAPRIALGEDALVMSVINGKGAMPPKAGNPNLSEEEIRAAVKHLIGTADAPAAAASAAEPAKEAPAAQTGAAPAAEQKTDSAAAADTVAAAPTSTAGAVATTSGKPGDEVYNTGCVACHATGAANAPKLNDKAAWEPRAATGLAALVNSVVKGKGAMPARGGLSNLSDADAENAVRYMLKEAGVEAGG